MSQQATNITLATNQEIAKYDPYQLQLSPDKPIKKDTYTTRTRAIRECIRQRRSFMKFVIDNPSQADTQKIDSNTLLRWLGLA